MKLALLFFMVFGVYAANAQFSTIEDACKLSNFQSPDKLKKCLEINNYDITRSCTIIGLKGDEALMKCIGINAKNTSAHNKIQLCAQFGYNQEQLLDCAITCANPALEYNEFLSCLQTRK